MRFAKMCVQPCPSLHHSSNPCGYCYSQLRNSVSPVTYQSLAKFTYDSALKYKRGGPGERLDEGFTIHNAILVRLIVIFKLGHY